MNSVQLQQFIQHAYENAPAVRAILDGANLVPADIRTLADLDRIPVTSKDRLVELQQASPPFGGFLAVPFQDLRHVFLSPGPLYEPHAADSVVMGSVREMLAIVGFEAADVVINTFGYHLIPTGLALDRTLGQIGATVIPAGVGNAELQVRIMRDLGVTGYMGTPSWLMALIQSAADMGLALREEFSLQKILVSAEPLTPALRQVFVEGHGLRVTNAYGTAELGFLAYNTEGGLSMRLLETSIIQVVDSDTGESVDPGQAGEVVVTTLDRTYPLVRLGTGDLAVNVDPAPGRSQQGERSIILVGRVGDAVKVRGLFVHPNQLKFAAAQMPEVERFQAVVTRPENRDELILRVVLAGTASASEATAAALSTSIQSVCRVRVVRVEFVSSDELDQGAGIIRDERTWG